MPSPDRWFITLQVAARHGARARRQFTEAELDDLEATSRLLVAQDQDVALYPPAFTAFAESMFALLDHWRNGTVSALEVAAAYWFLDDMAAWRSQYYGNMPAVNASVARWYDLLAHIAAELLAAHQPIDDPPSHVEDWFAQLHRCAVTCCGPKTPTSPITWEELDQFQAGGRAFLEADQASSPYPPAVVALRHALARLIGHWRDGTATGTEVATACTLLGGNEPLHLPESSAVPLSQRRAIRREWRELLGRMAAELLRGGPEPVELTVQQAATRMNRSVGHVRRLVRENKLPSVKRGTRRMILHIDASDLYVSPPLIGRSDGGSASPR